jgi:hypothetical protein
MNAVLDVGAGLVLMYLVLSLLCTTLNEFVSGLVNLRSRTLKNALEQLIDDPNLKALFYNHGLIDGARVAASGGALKPTPAPAAAPATPTAAPPTAPPAQSLLGRLLQNDRHPAYLASRDVAMALIGSLAAPDAIPTIADVKTSVQGMKDGNIRDILLGCLAEAEDDIGKLRDAIAKWFDASMDRLSGAYRRYMQWISFVVGLLVAVALNADTFHVVQVLWQNPTLAGAMAQNGASFIAANPDLQNLTLPDNAACTKPADNAAAEEQQTYRLCILDAQALAFPIGWNAWPSWPGAIWQILGLFATAVALSMGAPFWFDVLSKFVNIRGTGAKPQPVATGTT